jgi:cytoskeletal protein RodZ
MTRKHIGKLLVLLFVVIGATACGNAENLEDVPVDGEINSEQPTDTAPSENEMTPQEPADGEGDTEINSEQPTDTAPSENEMIPQEPADEEANTEMNSEDPAGSELETEK